MSPLFYQDAWSEFNPCSVFQHHHTAVSSPKLLRKDGWHNTAKDSGLPVWWVNTSRYTQTDQNPNLRDKTGSFKNSDWCSAHIAMFPNPKVIFIHSCFMVAMHELHSCLSWALRMRDFPEPLISLLSWNLDRWGESLSLLQYYSRGLKVTTYLLWVRLMTKLQNSFSQSTYSPLRKDKKNQTSKK